MLKTTMSKKMRSKILCSLLLISLICAPFSVQTVNAVPTIKITSQTVTETGACEVIGYITDYKPDTMVTFLMFEGTDVSKITADKIIYIAQSKTGNNGAFIFRCNVHWLRGGKQAQIRIGNNAGAPTYSSNITLPPLPPDIDIVDDNSVMYGRDIYYVPGANYKGDYIADSLTDAESTRFGKDILYKIGGMWFNLSSDDATSNSYLISVNAMSETVVELRFPRSYYSLTQKITLKYIFETGENGSDSGSSPDTPTVDVPIAEEEFE